MLGQGGVVLRCPTQHVLGSVVPFQMTLQRLANKTTEEETNPYGDVDSSTFLSHGTGLFLTQ